MKKYLLKTKIYYGWFIVIAGFMIMSTAWGIIYNCTSIFINPICQDMGFKRSDISVIITLSMLCQMVVALLAGKIFARVKLKRLMQVSTITLILSYYFYSFAYNINTFYLLATIASISSAFLTVLPLSLIINNWFYEKKGLAMGIVFMGSGVGGMIIGSLLGRWITIFGWRISYQLLSLIMFFILIPSTFFIIEVSPNDLGLTALGKTSNHDTNMSEDTKSGIFLKDALRTGKFWVLLMCLMVGGIGLSTSFFTISPRLIDIGYSIEFSANLNALTMGSLAINKLILGDLLDRIGVRASTLISTFFNLLGIIGLIYAKNKIFLILIVIGIGMGNALGTVALPIITEKMYGHKDFNSIYGVVFAASNLGAVIGPTMNGYMFDIIGSYHISYLVIIILTIFIMVLYSIILPNNKRVYNVSNIS